MSDSPNLRGRRVYMAAADHPHADQEGVVVDQVPCWHGDHSCGHDLLTVRLDDGTETTVFEPEAGLAHV